MEERPFGRREESGDYSPVILTLTDEEGQTFRFEVLDETDVNDRHYLAVVEHFDDPQKELEADPVMIIFRSGEPDEEGLETFDVVDDDEEYVEVSEIFEKRLSAIFDIEE